MPSSVSVIEPLLSKLRKLVKAGEKHCLTQALTLFGSESDISELCEVIRRETNAQRTVLVDLSPFESLGTKPRLTPLVNAFARNPFVVLVRMGLALEQLKELGKLALIVLDETGSVVRTTGMRRKWAGSLGRPKTIYDARHRWVEKRIVAEAKDAVRLPPVGRRYLHLSDGTWANQWIDVKSILRNPEAAFSVSYQLGYLLTDGYSRPLVEDGFVVGNNTAYILGGFLQHIFEDKDLLVIDRLGPFPQLSGTRLTGMHDRVAGRKFCVVEDVVSTGREVDLVSLLLFAHTAKVLRAVALFDLGIASPLLIPKGSFLALSQPSRQLKYQRVPKYKIAEGTK